MFRIGFAVLNYHVKESTVTIDRKIY